ncbi:MAG: Calx-beta domain-containing protein, partial [Chloroflexales bacterium]
TPTRQPGGANPVATAIRNPIGQTSPVTVATNTPNPTATRAAPSLPTQIATATATRQPIGGITPTSTVTPTTVAAPTSTPAPVVTLAFVEPAIFAREDDGSVSAVVNVTIKPAGAVRANTVSVSYATSDGSATAGLGQDYLAASGTLTFPPGTDTAQIPITILTDTIKEPNETVLIKLSNLSGATISGPDTATLTIYDQSSTPTVRFVGNASTLTEGTTGRAYLSIALSNASTSYVSVPYTISGSATVGSDYTGLSSGTVSIPPGATSVRLPFDVINDLIAEDPETIVAEIGAPTNANLGTPAKYIFTINDNDVAGVNVSTKAGTTSEANGAQKQMTFGVWLNSQPTADVTIPLASSDPSEGTVSPDSLTFTPANWRTAQTVTVTGVDDAVVDGDIAYQAQLGAASSADPFYGAKFAQAISLTNLDNDSATVSINSVTAPEGNAGTTPFVFTVSLSIVAARDVSVDYTTLNQTAIAGSDYITNTGTLTIPAGSLTGTITVNVKGNTTVEPDRVFAVQLSNLRTSGAGPIAVTLGNSQGTGTIRNDDTLTMTISSPSILEGNTLT